MTNQFSRRKFIKKSTLTGLAGCTLLMSAKLNPLHAFDHLAENNEAIDPSKLNFCGYTCPAECEFLKATKENNTELKKDAYEKWHLKERYNVDFDEKKIFCWGCKVDDEKAGVVVGNCPIRNCAKERGHEACIQCETLKTCEKDLWKRFPDFHKSIIEMQEIYQHIYNNEVNLSITY